ncbi:MAG: hypothetical protein JW969_17450 [Spirochaetales bacterium]|nr:hypothetical protein [Spirochaetales bacterium]
MNGVINRDYYYLNTNNKLSSYLEGLEENKCSSIALDIEAESNLHAYGEKLCLVQVFDGSDKVLIDPFKIDVAGLRDLFENRKILKIMYDASSDSSLLKNVYDIEIKSILDLRPAVELLLYQKNDLHSVIAAELGLTFTGKTRFQRYNWTRRPINKAAIDYALNDVAHLFKLKDIFLKKLCDGNLLEAFILKNLQVQNRDYTRNTADRHLRVKGYRGLSKAEKSIFKNLFDIREKYAKRYNVPAYRVIRSEDLLVIARDKNHIDDIRLPQRFNRELVNNIKSELKNAYNATKAN